jgi:phage terminase small subunit
MTEIKPKLTEKQKAFCREYILNGWNGTKAAIKAGYSFKTAKVIANENLTKPYLNDYIKELRGDIETLTGINKEKILTAFAEIAFNSINYYNETWLKRIEFESLSKEAKSCIQEIEHRVNYIDVYTDSGKKKKVKIDEVRFKLYSRTDALKEINKMLGYNEPIKTDLKTDLNIIWNETLTKKD